MVKTKLTFNKKPKYKSKSLYHFKKYFETFEGSSTDVLFIKTYLSTGTSNFKYYRRLPFSRNRRSC